MRIERIEIENYRQYKDQTFEFQRSKNDMHVIIAQNGVGKSNLLNAITWCLYNEETHLQDRDKALPILNIDVISQMLENQTAKVIVKILINIDEVTYEFCRESRFKKTKTDNMSISLADNIFFASFDSYDPILGYPRNTVLEGEQASRKVNQIFPKKVNQYFFFDNEQMNNYFNVTGNDAIKNAIFDISGISTLQRVNSRLFAMLQDKRRELQKNYPSIEPIHNDLTNAQNHYDEVKGEYDRKKHELESAKKEYEQLDNYLKNQIDIEEVEEKITKKEKRLKELIDSQNDSIISMQRFIYTYTYLLSFYKKLNKAKDFIHNKESLDQLPPPIDVDLLHSIIEKSNHGSVSCPVCNQTIDEVAKEYIMQALKKNELTSRSGSLLVEHRMKIQEMLNKTKKFNIDKKKLLKSYYQINNALKETEESLTALRTQEKTVVNKEELKRKIEIRNRLDKLIKDSERELIKKEYLFESAQKKLNEMEEKYQSYLKKMDKKGQLEYDALILNHLYDLGEKSEKNVIADFRKEISEKTYNQFVSLIWKKHTYSNVIVTDDYSVDLIHKDGYSAIGSTSAAERSLLALAFTNAMHEVSGFENPLVIDSPVGRVSDINRKKFAEVLLSLSRDKQLILLFTPDEYSKDIADVLDGNVQKYKAEMDAETESVTFVKKVGG